MEQTTINFEDIFGASSQEQEIAETIDFNLNEEQEEEQQEEEVETPPAEPQVKKEEVQVKVFDSKVKELIESGDWDANYMIEDENGNKTPLSELTDVDEETFKEIKKVIDQEKEQEFTENFIEVKGLNETQKSLINIIKSGDLAKIKEVFETPENLQEPFTGYDSKNDNHNIQVLTFHYKNQGFSDKKIKSLIEVAQEDLTLDVEAEAIVNSAREQFKKAIQNKEKEIKEAKAEEEKARKEYEKALVEGYKKDYNFPDTLIKKIVKATTVPDADGELPVDKVFEQLMKDPKEAMEVALFLLNREEYKNRVKAPVKNQENLNMYKKIKVIRDTTKKTSAPKEEKTDNFFENLTFDINK